MKEAKREGKFEAGKKKLGVREQKLKANQQVVHEKKKDIEKREATLK